MTVVKLYMTNWNDVGMEVGHDTKCLQQTKIWGKHIDII